MRKCSNYLPTIENSSARQNNAVVVQCKLTVGASNDPLEHEADATADKVMRMPENPFIQRKSSCACNEYDDERVHLKRMSGNQAPFLQAKGGDGGTVSNSVSNKIQSTRGSGNPIPRQTQSFMESRFGQDFSDVRIHTGDGAAEMSKELRAQAFTIGKDIYFNSSRYAPDSSDGKRLLAHELTHVVQQKGGHTTNGNASRIMRQGEHEGNQAPTADSIIQTWLDQNQFAPPATQPNAPDEPHVILQGQDMTVSQAVDLVARNTHQPAEAVRRIISGLLARQWSYSARGAAFVGPGNLVPGLPLFPQNAADQLRLGKAMDLSRVDDWLDAHHFYQPVITSERGDVAVIDGRETTIGRVAALALASLGNAPFVTLDEVVIQIRRRYVDAPNAPGAQAIIGYSFIPRFAQGVTAYDPNNPLRNQHQLTFTMTWARHTSADPGAEYSVQGGVTLDDSGQILNVQGGGQAAYIIPLLHNWIQISGFVQLMASANWSRPIIGSASVSPAVQAAVGAQILLTPPSPPAYNHVRMFNRHIALGVPQVGVQVLGTLQETIPTDGGGFQAPQAGVSGGIVFNLPWDIRR